MVNHHQTTMWENVFYFSKHLMQIQVGYLRCIEDEILPCYISGLQAKLAKFWGL